MLTVEQVMASHKANIETLLGLTSKAFEGVEKIVDLNMTASKAALAEAGDLVQPLADGTMKRSHVLGELAQLVRADIPGRQSAQEITLFKSVGTALEDLAAARMVLAGSR